MGFPKIYPVIVDTKSYLKSYNFYIVQDKDNTFLIDAGIDTDKCWNLLNNELSHLGLSIKDLDFIVLTHHHIDHIGLINRIRSEIDIRVYAHPKAFPHLERDNHFLTMRIDFFKRLYKEMGCEDRGRKRINEMKDALEKNKHQAINGSFLPLMSKQAVGSFQVIDVPGHASDHIAFYEATTGQIVLGDNLFSHMNSNALIEPDENGKIIHSVIQYEQTLNKLNDLFLTTAFPGHGKIIDNPKQLIENRLQHMLNKSERIKKTIINNKLTPAQIARHLYGDLYEKLFYFVMSEVIGHLYRLKSLGEVTYDIKDNVRYYYVL